MRTTPVQTMHPQPEPAHAQARARLAVVASNFAPETTGIAPYSTAAAVMLRRAGYNVEAMTTVPHYPHWRVPAEYQAGRFWRESYESVTLIRRRPYIPAANSVSGRAAMEASIYAGARLDVQRSDAEALLVFTPSLASLMAAQHGRRGRPLAVIVQDLVGNAADQSATTGAGLASRVAQVEYSLLRHADLVGVISKRFAEILIREGVDPARLRYMPNFAHVSSTDIGKAEAKQMLGLPRDRTVVLHTGNMGQKQGLEWVVAAARLASQSHPDLHFVLMGDGNARAHLEQISAGLENLELRPLVPAEQYPVTLAAADVLLVNERPGVLEMSLPSKITSYTTASRPIVAAVEAKGTTAELLRSYEAAAIVAPGKPEALVEALRRVADDSALEDRLIAAAARLHHEEYSAAAAQRRYLAFVEELMALR